jgi:hypothetical protein
MPNPTRPAFLPGVTPGSQVPDPSLFAIHKRFKALEDRTTELEGDVTTLEADTGGGGTGGTGVSEALIGAWSKQHITTLPTSAPGDELYSALSKDANDLMSVVPHKAGEVTGISAFCSGSVSGVVYLDVYVNGVAQGLSFSVAYAAASGYATCAISLAAGDLVTVYAHRAGGENDVRMTVYLWGKLG